MTVTATVEFTGHDRARARQVLEDAGFTVVRVAIKRDTTAVVTPFDPDRRASAVIDMPEGLNRMERKAYVRGYARGCESWAKKHGSVGGTATESWDSIRERTKRYEWDRHADCHKAGMKELDRWRTHWADHIATLERQGLLVPKPAVKPARRTRKLKVVA